MRDAGLEPRVDAAGNLVGRRASCDSDRVLLVGSHLDSVPGGGRYDGVLGVLMAVAVAEALGETPLPFHLDVVGFCEEEGVRFDKPYLGSSAVADCFDDAWLGRADANGVCMRDALTDFGGDPARLAEAAYHADRVLGFIEPHLEQGPVLERVGEPVGVVSGIAGQSRLRLEIRGEAGHAGTTPMPGRHDALVAAAEIVSTARRVAGRTEGLRATVGKIEVLPNAPNVIPDRVELSLDVRHPLDGVREAAVGAIVAEAGQVAQTEGCRFTILEDTATDAVAVDDDLTGHLAAAIGDAGREAPRVVSGAGHDAVVMARRFPVAMLFVRHPGAVSHHPDERVDAADVAVGVDVLTKLVTRIAQRVPLPVTPGVAT